MVVDKNKGIETIVYNHLNLPTRIFIQTDDQKGEINYIYDATGVKLAKKVTDYISETSLTTIYANGFIYEQKENQVPELKFFAHAEGYFEPTETSPSGELEGAYIYQYKDHLGNIRLSYKDNNGNLEIVEENNYYPFGLKHKGYNNQVTSTNPALNYKFGGKEYQDELGLGWYDVSARNYDPALGRWMNIDPLAEKMRRHSPYNFAFNNPIYWQDYDGMAPTGPWPIPKSLVDFGNYISNKIESGLNSVQTTISEIGQAIMAPIYAIDKSVKNGGGFVLAGDSKTNSISNSPVRKAKGDTETVNVQVVIDLSNAYKPSFKNRIAEGASIIKEGIETFGPQPDSNSSSIGESDNEGSISTTNIKDEIPTKSKDTTITVDNNELYDLPHGTSGYSAVTNGKTRKVTVPNNQPSIDSARAVAKEWEKNLHNISTQSIRNLLNQ